MRFVVGVSRRAGLTDGALLLLCFSDRNRPRKVAWSWYGNSRVKELGIVAKIAFQNARDAGVGQRRWMRSSPCGEDMTRAGVDGERQR